MWSSYRDELVSVHVDELTDELSQELGNRLRRFSESFEDPAAREAAQSLLIIYLQQVREDSSSEKSMSYFEKWSLSKACMTSLKIVMHRSSTEYRGFGTGCQQRMRQHLIEGFNQNIQEIKSFTYSKIKECIEKSSGSLVPQLKDLVTKRYLSWMKP